MNISKAFQNLLFFVDSPFISLGIVTRDGPNFTEGGVENICGQRRLHPGTPLSQEVFAMEIEVSRDPSPVTAIGYIHTWQFFVPFLGWFSDLLEKLLVTFNDRG